MLFFADFYWNISGDSILITCVAIQWFWKPFGKTSQNLQFWAQLAQKRATSKMENNKWANVPNQLSEIISFYQYVFFSQKSAICS